MYKVKDGIEFLAATPTTADNDFIKKAKECGFDLATITLFDSTPHQCFINDDTNQIVTPKSYLAIVNNTKTAIAIPESLFISIFESITQTPSSPPAPVTQSLKGLSFYLDAGHGGKDPGAVNDNLGLQEKIAALDIILILGEKLQARGADVYYSRTDDSYPSLSQRASDANAKNVTAFISVHLNSAENKTASGIETLVYGNTGKAYELAEAVQANMVAVTGFKNRGVKLRPDLTVLAKTKMPAILCEVGFISNDDEAKQLFTKDIQNKLATAIADGVQEEFGN